MLDIGKIVTLNEKEYIVINIIKINDLSYVFLISNSKPLDIIIGTERYESDEYILEEVKDSEELDYVLSNFVLGKN